MSGAEAAIAGVGFLCSAIQIVTFGRDILQVYCQVRDGRSPDPRLEGYLKSAEACFDQMKASASASTQTQALNSDQQQVIQVGNELHDSMMKLQSKFADLHLDDASKRGLHGKMRVGKKALASMWHSKELGSLEENLKRYESLLHGIMIHRLCNQVQAAEIQSSHGFHQLNTDLQLFITKLADGCTNISDLSTALRETRHQITQEHEKTRTAMDQGFTSTQASISSFRDSTFQHIQDSAQREMSKDFKEQHKQLLESLRFSEMNTRKNQVSKNYPGTFSWVFEGPFYCSQCRPPSRGETDDEMTDDEDIDDDISLDTSSESVAMTDLLDHDSFSAWLESDSKLFWISGKPASGKSSLMKFLATNSLTRKHLEFWQQNTQNTSTKLCILTHFFWKPGQSLQNNIQGMLLSLLHQVLCKDLCLAQQLLEDRDVSDKRALGDWSLNELREALCHTIRSSGDAFCLFLDGLDEAREMERLSWRDRGNAQVVHDLLDLTNVKIFASSREEHPFCLFFNDIPRLRIHLLTYNDLASFADGKLESSGLDSSSRVEILQTVVKKANGVFLWVVLVVDSINRAILSGTASTDEMQERLAQTPADLNDLLIDMWERPGDDAKLSSYRNDASRCLSLAVTANNLQRAFEGAKDDYDNHSLQSLLVMATALEGEPLTSILDTGRYIQAKDLQARCVRIADRLRLVSRGLLEIVPATSESDLVSCEGNPRLIHCDAQRVEFIHRSAFDFITDTQFGQDCLSTCHWSSVEQVSRLIAGHLVRCRFLHCEPEQMWGILDLRNTRYNIVTETSFQLKRALMMTWLETDNNISLKNSMLQMVKDWQESGLFSASSCWKYPQKSKVPSNPWELEFLEQFVVQTTEFAFVSDLLDNLSIGRLIDAIPALLRGSIHGFREDMDSSMYWELIGYILTRLTNAYSERQESVSPQAQASIRNATFLLHSWFITQCLWAVTTDEISELQVFLNLLHRFRNTLSSNDDWHYTLTLSFREDPSSVFSPQSLYHYTLSVDHTIVAITNFVTAYRLLSRLLQDRLCYTLCTQAPENLREQFEVVLISGESKPWDSPQEMFSPTTEYHGIIAAHLENTLFRKHSKDFLKKREEEWQALVHFITDGLMSVGDESVEYCEESLQNAGWSSCTLGVITC